MAETETFITDPAGNIWVIPAGGGPMARTGGSAATAANTAKVITVSPYGIANGHGAVANSGAQYGPDTPGTVTSGIQEAVNAAVAAGLAGTGYDVQLLAGVFRLSAFTNTTFRIAVAIDAGYGAATGPPVSVTIRGTGAVFTTAPEGTAFADSYNLGATVIDASALDSLAQGLYKQGRVFGVVPRDDSGTGFSGENPLNAVQLRIDNMSIIVPTYNVAGTGGPTYNFTGTQMGLFVNGDTQSSSTAHWQFVNGIDAWAASAFQVRNVSVISAIAAWNPAGNQWAGGGGVFAYGSAAGIVFPHDANQANCYFETISSYDLHTGMMISTHTAGTQYYAQGTQHVLYYRSSGHGARIERMLGQSQNILIQHQLMNQLTNSLSGAFFDPIGDLYAPIGMTFPTAASASSLTIGEVAIEAALGTFLKDDASNPLTLVANADYTGSVAAASWGGGANLMINFTDVSANAQKQLAGTTAGTVTYSQSGTTPWDKRLVAYLGGYENTTATAQTITFVVPYNNAPAIVKDSTSGATVSATTLTLPASMGSPVTGYIILEGY